ncbi:MAG TPA: aminotransferase class I/II-fold pyridoxal phosphate-dependent enzyme [Bryobacteraceae bacterium]|jgi:glycine C-acetyltransferase|nr:aminotransferase class I/II-fold pyridoxal phosphate-dependent enzyme [Bryobacteraceae bacterium]
MKQDPNHSRRTRVFAAGAGDLFDGFFSRNGGSGRKWNFQKEDLVDGRARRVFELMGRACDAGVYPYQLALEGRSGPWVEAEGREFLMLSSYDYLGLIGDARIDEAAIEAIRKYGTGTGGVRMLTGTIDLHHEMERDIAAWKGTAEAITFSSGYLANLAVIASLLTAQDRVILDALSHRSLVDACRLAGVPLQRFRHNDMDSLRHEIASGAAANRTLIIADGVFSMDGDICNLPGLVEIKREAGCYLMIDESHASGVLGAQGRGTDEHFGIRTDEVDIWSGSLAKAIPSNGGFVAVSRELAIFLQHSAAPFIFSAALAPPAVAAVRTALAILKDEPERVERIKRNADFLRDGLRALGFDTGYSETAIIPVILHDEAAAALMAGRLREMGICVTPILFPAVPMGSARLRLCVTAAHTIEDLELALDAFRQVRG